MTTEEFIQLAVDNGFSRNSAVKALQAAQEWVEGFEDCPTDYAELLPGIFDSQPGWESVEAAPHFRVRYGSYEPGCVSQEMPFYLDFYVK